MNSSQPNSLNQNNEINDILSARQGKMIFGIFLIPVWLRALQVIFQDNGLVQILLYLFAAVLVFWLIFLYIKQRKDVIKFGIPGWSIKKVIMLTSVLCFVIITAAMQKMPNFFIPFFIISLFYLYFVAWYTKQEKDPVRPIVLILSLIALIVLFVISVPFFLS